MITDMNDAKNQMQDLGNILLEGVKGKKTITRKEKPEEGTYAGQEITSTVTEDIPIELIMGIMSPMMGNAPAMLPIPGPMANVMPQAPAPNPMLNMSNGNFTSNMRRMR
jgi:hypothetical protein